MVAILFLIGSHLEKPSIISELLDLKKYHHKPTYLMASEIPLVLYECDFDDLEFIYDKEILGLVYNQFFEKWKELALKTTVAQCMISGLNAFKINSDGSLWENVKGTMSSDTKHVPLEKRLTEKTYEDKAKEDSEREIKTIDN
eukprot:TRINITY_DN1007_c0_g1_i1.p1 TRINITY_DN1007_c0_g1~~TRINITY_DN1007_c0_g1_i1.p1  ORF type:complete len:143 (-),score=21.02 TRINITY_DN1007_c0_g1_i1:124-552(-)